MLADDQAPYVPADKDKMFLILVNGHLLPEITTSRIECYYPNTLGCAFFRSVHRQIYRIFVFIFTHDFPKSLL